MQQHLSLGIFHKHVQLNKSFAFWLWDIAENNGSPTKQT